MKPKILVTGGTGFVGRHLVNKLSEREHSVRILTRKVMTGNGSTPHGVEYVTGSFADPEILETALDGIESVYHLAVTTTPGKSNDLILFDAQTNLSGSLTLLQACVKAGVQRFIFMSSGGSVYGPTENQPIPEDAPLNPIAAHGVSKLAVEKYLDVYRHQFQMEYRVARGGNPFGEYQDPARGQGFIAYALRQIISQEEIVIWGDGSVVRDFFYVGDLAEALIMMLTDHSHNRIYNVGSGQGRSINEVLNLIETQTGLRANVRYVNARKADVPYNCLDIKKIQAELGWTPRTGMMDGLERTQKWIQASIQLEKELRSI